MARPKKGTGKGSRRSKAEDSTGAKENEAEMRTPQLEGLTIDDGDFDLHLASVRRAVEQQKRAKNGYDACCKAAKKVSPALLDAIKFAIKLDGMEADEVKRELEIKGYALKRTNSPVQLTVHDTLLGDVKDTAYNRGYQAGSNGQTLNNPYPANSDLAEAFQTGWRNGQGANLGLAVDQTDEATSGIGHNSANGASEHVAQS